jgi:hypothetical protein
MVRRGSRAWLVATAVLAACDGGGSGPNDGGPPASDGAPGSAAMAPPALEVLSRPPFVPRNLALFARAVFPAAPAPIEAPAPGVDEAASRALLAATLRERPGLTPETASATAALFDDPTLQRLVPPPPLRAALLLLRGTAGEAAIAAVTSGAFASVGFAAPPPFVGDSAAWVDGAAGKGSIFVADWARFEDPRALASVLAHETLHSDADVQSKEEAIAAALESIIYGQLLLETPALAHAGTRLAAYDNTRLLERLDSRDESGQLRLTYSSGPTLPGSQTGYGFFMEYYEPFFGRSTAGNPTLQAIARAVTGTTPSGGFDNALVELLDRNQVALAPEDLVRLAGTLELDTAPAAPLPLAPRPPAAPPAAPAPAPDAEALQILRMPPFTPKNPGLFDRGAYPAEPPDVDAGPPGPDPALARHLLYDTLSHRFGDGDPRAVAAVAAFDGAALQAAVPSPSLRAALLLLRGTAGDTVIGAFEAGVFARLDFIEPLIDLPFSTVLRPSPGAAPGIALNGALRFEDPRLLAPWIVEAALHEDAVKTPKELLLGRAVVPLLHAQFLLETPELARTGTRLARILNRVLLGRLNSRDAEGKLRLLEARGNIFPGSAGSLDSYLGVYIPFGPDTPGSRTMWDVVGALTGTTGFEGPFSVATIRTLDQSQALLTAGQVVTLLRTLELDVP